MKSNKQPRTNKIIKRINYTLLGIILLSNGYVLFGFFRPAIEPSIKRIVAPVHTATPAQALSEPDSLIIPKIQVRTPVRTGDSADALKNAAWLRPASVEPDKGGNTILAGHRFSYQVASVFYNLDKLQLGDTVQLIWKNKLYTYHVTEVYEVSPDAIEIEGQNFGERLTLYTCTPLWSTARRLVIIGERI